MSALMNAGRELFVLKRLAVVALLVVPSLASAQNAKLDVRVSVSTGASAAGFYVCVGTSSNRGLYGTALTPANGMLNDQFDGLSADQTVVVTVNKSGFQGKQSSVELKPGKNDPVEFTVTTGSGGPVCPGSTVSPSPPAPVPPAPVSPTPVPPAPVAPAPQPAPAPPPAVPASITPAMPATSTYAGKAGAPMTYELPMTVTVRDASGNPVQGIKVAFAVTGGGGSITPASVATGTDGKAHPSSWTLGATPGLNTASASVAGLPAAALKVFGALSATSIETASVASQEAVAGGGVTTKPAVLVRDQFNNPMPNAGVTFTVTSGGGSVSPSTVVSTGTNGIATLTSWLLGAAPGANTVSAKAVSTPAVTFSATGVDRYTLVVFVKRADQTAIQDAQICIGSTSDPDQYAAVKSGATYGRATFNVPGASQYVITAAKGGFVGKAVPYPVTGTSGATTITLSPGTGGATCPGMLVQLDATTATPISPDPAPARLGSEALAVYGTIDINPTYVKLLDCHSFGTSAVMVGLSGRHGAAVDELNVLCQRLQPDGKLNSTVLKTERWDNFDAAGTTFNRQCPAGSVVSGVTYSGENLQLRSIVLHCTPLGTNGLTTGATIPQAPIGTVTSAASSAKMCTGGRPARAFKLSTDMIRIPVVSDLAPTVWIVVASQLFCEQPVKP